MTRPSLVPGVMGLGSLFASALVLAVVVWLLYLAVRVAQHVQAWPF